MKSLFFAVSLGLAASCSSFAAPSAIWENYGVTNLAPTIDATVFANHGVIAITNSNVSVFTITDPYELTPYVFDTQDTYFFTNWGVMVGTLGFQFDTVEPSAFGWKRIPAQSFVNLGTITGADDANAYYDGGFLSLVTGYGTLPNYGSYVGVFATNIANTGLMSVGDAGLMQIGGKNVDLSQGGLAAGTFVSDQTNLDSSSIYLYDYYFNTSGRGYLVGTNEYVNSTGVEDIYWAAGMEGGFPLIELTLGTPDGWTPYDPFSTLTNTSFFQAWAYTNVGFSNTYINIVFVRTNDTSDNFVADVRFCSPMYSMTAIGTNVDYDASEAIVRLGSSGKDVITGIYGTNSFYLLDDGLAEGTFNLLTNALTSPTYPTERPSCFEVTTTAPYPEWFFANPPNIPYTPDLITPGLDPNAPYLRDTGSGPFAEYGAQIGLSTSTVNGELGLLDYLYYGIDTSFYESYTNTIVLTDPTNQPARIEISGDRLDLSNARIRAEGLLKMTTKHLVTDSPVSLDAGNMVIDFASTNGFLCISNVLPSTFSRARGNIYCWCMNWTNSNIDEFGITNYYKFHVLVVDHAVQSAAVPVIRDLALRATNIYAQDTLYVNKSALFQGKNLVFNGPVSLVQDAQTFDDSVAPELQTFLVDTNGVLYADNQISLGLDSEQGLVSWTNRGSVVAQVIQIESSLIENSGYIHSSNSLFLTATTNQFLTSKKSLRNPDAGTLNLTTNVNPLLVVTPGTQITNMVPVPSQILSEWDTEITARALKANYSVISNGMTASGSLNLTVSDELSDDVAAVPGTNNVLKNYWYVQNGFNLTQKPAVGDLFGTEITTVGAGYSYIRHTWAGEDRGPGVTGFSNNVVIGHLILDRKSTNCALEFAGTGARNGLYVDYLDLQDFAYSDYGNGLLISPNLVIYFAASNVDPGKLATSYPGRLVWVPEFAGPNSSTVVLAHINGVVTNIFANQAMAQNKEIDSNGNGIPNYWDTFPFDGTFLSATVTGAGVLTPNLNGTSLVVGSTNTINAIAGQGYFFTNWVVTSASGSIVSASPQLTFTMQSNLTVQANFVPDPSYLIVTVNGAGTVTPDTSLSSLIVGRKYHLTAAAQPGSVFAGWTGGLVSSAATLNFVMTPYLALQANFVTNQLVGLTGAYSGLFYGVDNGATNAGFDNSGAFTLSLTRATGPASGKVIMNSGVYPFTADFNWDGTAQITVNRGSALPSLAFSVALDPSNGGSVTGSIGDGKNWLSQVQGYRAMFNVKNNPAPMAGTYTFALPGVADGNGPAGDVYGIITVTGAGVATANVKLADGTIFSQSGAVSQNGQWPFYYTRAGKDALLSMITFNTNDASVGTMVTNQFIGLSGNMFWNRMSNNAAYYKSGFSYEADIIGSWFTPSQQGGGLFLTTPTMLELTGGNLAKGWDHQVAFDSTTTTYTSPVNDTVLTISPRTGTFTGKLVNSSGKAILFNGVVLQRQNQARGCFYGPSQSGEVLLQSF